MDIYAKLKELKFEHLETPPVGGLYTPANFYQQPKIMDGASSLLVEVFGNDRGIGAHSAIGRMSFPGFHR